MAQLLAPAPSPSATEVPQPGQNFDVPDSSVPQALHNAVIAAIRS
jgi:hypothetical protein